MGAAYLNLQGPADVAVLKVVGGTGTRAGLPASFRIVSSWANKRKGAEVRVDDVRVDGTSRLETAVSGTPALVTVNIPANVGDEVALAFDVETQGRKETLHVQLPVRHMSPGCKRRPSPIG